MDGVEVNGYEIGPRTDLRGADLRRADLRGADLGCADLRGADLRGAGLRKADLRGAKLRRAVLYLADLRGADLRKADLRKADLRGVFASSENLERAILTGAMTEDVELTRANLTDADVVTGSIFEDVSTNQEFDPDDLASTLAEAWERIKKEKDAQEITRLVTDAVLAWAQANDWSARKEERIKVDGYVSPRGKSRSSGLIDIWCRSLWADLAIEIDRTNKSWSLAKLVQAQQNGAHAVWVRWVPKGKRFSTRSYPKGPVVPAGIHLIKLGR